ncbi:hypothetical protein PMAYCL1PPCAC_09315, partial [Pristionchus mayeri]
CTLEEELIKETEIYVTDDGTIFYKFPGDESTRSCMYVKWQGSEVKAVLPKGAIDYVTVHGISIYLEVQLEIYQLTFCSSIPSIAVREIRELWDDEIPEKPLETSPIISRIHDGNTYVYRLCDDPKSEGILVDEAVDGATLIAIHEGKQIYASSIESDCPPKLYQLNERTYHIEVPTPTSFESRFRDSSRFAYIAQDPADKRVNVLVLDLENMAFLPELQIIGIEFIYSIHVCGNIMTIKGACYKAMDDEFRMSVQLPDGYFDENIQVQDNSNGNTQH